MTEKEKMKMEFTAPIAKAIREAAIHPQASATDCLAVAVMLIAYELDGIRDEIENVRIFGVNEPLE